MTTAFNVDIFKTMTITIALMWLFVLVQCGPELREPKYISQINVWKYVYMRQARGVHDYESEVTDICVTGQN